MFLGRKHTEETKKKMSISNRRTMLGKHHNEETRKKMSLSHKGRVVSEKTRERMRIAWQRRKKNVC
jgi:hypothetical protein